MKVENFYIYLYVYYMNTTACIYSILLFIQNLYSAILFKIFLFNAFIFINMEILMNQVFKCDTSISQVAW